MLNYEASTALNSSIDPFIAYQNWIILDKYEVILQSFMSVYTRSIIGTRYKLPRVYIQSVAKIVYVCTSIVFGRQQGSVRTAIWDTTVEIFPIICLRVIESVQAAWLEYICGGRQLHYNRTYYSYVWTKVFCFKLYGVRYVLMSWRSFITTPVVQFYFCCFHDSKCQTACNFNCVFTVYYTLFMRADTHLAHFYMSKLVTF